MSFEDKLKAIRTKGKELTTTTELTTNDNIITMNSIEEISEVLAISEFYSEINVEKIEQPTNVFNHKYSNASIIWNYLRNLGYNKAVCAGILGNIMAEVGGNTFSLDPYLYANGFYGICQWYIPYYPSISDTGLEFQLNYLADTIQSELNTFGYKYYNGFNYNTFLNLSDAGDAAEAFAKCYERCAAWTYLIRINNAYKAYEYFA